MPTVPARGHLERAYPKRRKIGCEASKTTTAGSGELPAVRVGDDWATGQSGSSSLKVRTPLTIVETIDWRDMMSSRIAT